MASSSKRQTTMAKVAREQAVREKRARKQEKKEYKKQQAAAALTAGTELVDGETAEGGNGVVKDSAAADATA
jgi:hypothetical protein